jgi:hypothetical protein
VINRAVQLWVAIDEPERALAVGRGQGDLARDDGQELLVRPVAVERELTWPDGSS